MQHAHLFLTYVLDSVSFETDCSSTTQTSIVIILILVVRSKMLKTESNNENKRN